MRKKTFIKVRRGILEPKHRRALGAAWFLYFQMLDMANWEDGIIYDWKDEDVAADLEMPVSTLRHQRRHLEDMLYISTNIKQYGLEITINNWVDPRLSDFEVNNQVDNLLTPQNQGDNQVNNQVNNQVANQVDNQVTKTLTPLHSNQDIKIIRLSDSKRKDISPHQSFISDFVTATRVQFTNDKQPQMIDDLVEDYGEKPVLEAARWYGNNNPSNMGHALKSIDTALRRGWNSKGESLSEYNKKLLEEVVNGN